MKKILFGLFLVAITLTSCTKDDNQTTSPTAVANFTVTNQNGTVSEKTQSLTLNNSSTNAVSYLWDFGNGVTSTEKEPSYTYPMCGDYNLKLTVTDSKGNKTTTQQDLIVLCIFGGHHPTTSAN